MADEEQVREPLELEAERMTEHDSDHGNNTDCKKSKIILAHESFLTKDGDHDTHSHVIKLRHPKTDECAIFSLNENTRQLFEIVTFKEKYRSWLLNDTVQQDGALHLLTPTEPLFIILPYLIKNASSKYMQLDQLIDDDSFCDCRRLSSLPLPDIECVANVKGSNDLVVYQYNEEKTLSWLQAKVDRLSEFLKSRNVNVGRGARSANYVHSLHSSTYTQEDYTKYAFGIVSDYLSTTLSDVLQKHLGLEFPVEKSPNIEPPIKKAKLVNGSGPTDDYSQGVKVEKKEKVTKMTAGQKKLQSADKTGMKSLSSFFSAKPKPKS